MKQLYTLQAANWNLSLNLVKCGVKNGFLTYVYMLIGVGNPT